MVLTLKMAYFLVKRVTHFHPKTGWEISPL